MSEFFNDRKCCVIREMTKIYEERIYGSFDEVIKHFVDKKPRGEMVVLLSPKEHKEILESDIDKLLKKELKSHKLKEAVKIVHEKLPDVSKKEIYQRALEIKEGT